MRVRLTGGEADGATVEVPEPLPEVIVLELAAPGRDGPATAAYRLASGFADPRGYRRDEG